MPDRCFSIGGSDLDAKESSAQGEQAVEHLGEREPGPQRFLVEIELFLPEFFSPIGHVPRLKIIGLRRVMTASTGAKCINLCFGGWLGSGPELLEQGFDCIHIAGHLAGQTEICPVGIAQALGLLGPQAED